MRPLLVLSTVLLVAGIAYPGAERGSVLALAWAALAAPAAGQLAGAERCADVRRFAPLLVALAVLYAFAAFTAAPVSAWAALVICGLFLLGLATGRATDGRWTGAGLWFALTLALSGAATGFGQLARPWPPELTAHLLDVSPVSLVLESAGVDWMRHPALYDPAGTLDIGPELRLAWRGKVAGPALFVVGCCALAVSSAWRARRAAVSPATHLENH
ncbi:MAG: hypothetical protein H6831_07815 [Planctomycetes bacterium]|nr:hypothetical protein [Planctomycetota bacterium]MCB9904298.1 hypothetical protein [Planctomycetota bacterium]